MPQPNQFTVDDYLEKTIEYVLLRGLRYGRHTIRVGNRFFREEYEVFAPRHVKRDPYSWEDWSVLDIQDLYSAYRNAELYRLSLVDESIPYRDDAAQYYFFLDGCRNMNAVALGMLGYWPALPDLREAMIHDLNDGFRQYCIDAMARMPLDKLQQYIIDIRICIEKHSNPLFRMDAVKTLGILDDIDSVPPLRELFEETRWKIRRVATTFYNYTEVSGELMLLEQIIKTLLKLDLRAARETIAIGLVDDNPHVQYFTKRGFDLYPNRGYLLAILNNPEALIDSLPKDPRWSLAHRL